MKKRLIMQLLALACVVCAQAAAIGDYLYSPTARYKVTGDNLVTNGTFAQGSGQGGWLNENGGTLSADIWSLEVGLGPNQENVLVSITGGSLGDNIALTNVWENLEPGFYTFSYWIKSETTATSSTTVGGTNYIDIFVNRTGARTKEADARGVAATHAYNDVWQLMVDTFTVAAGEQIVFRASNLAGGTMLTGFEIHYAKQVYDDRNAKRLVEYIDRLLADENLTEGREDLQAYIADIKAEVLPVPAVNEDEAYIENELIPELNDMLNQFLDANGANLVGIYLTDWTTWGKVNYNSMATRGTWTFEGGRWGFTGNEDYLEFKAGDGYIASAGIQTGMPSLNVGMRTAAGSLDALPPGKYFFSIEAQAVSAANRANPYGSNHNIPIVGPSIYVGSDSTVLQNDTLNGYYWKTYYKIAEIKEGDEMRAGFHFPVLDGTLGGRYSLRNPQVRQLGVTPEDMVFNQNKQNIIIQQVNLKKRMDEYPVELQGYHWEMDSLQRAIDTARPVYEASLLVIDAEGNVVDAAQVTAELATALLEQVNSLGRARSWVISSNQPIADLQAAIEAAKASLNDEANQKASAAQRAALEQAVSEGEALLAGVSAVNQADEFNAAIEKIKTAQEQFEATTATRANPTEIVIKNGDFSDFAANNNVTAAGMTKDWNWTMAASTSRWEIRDNATLPQGHGAGVWRGSTVQLDGRAQQTVSLAYEGLYEYRAMAYISEERVNELTNAAVCDIIYDAEEMPIDTIYKPNIRLFFGVEGAPDSITVSKCYMGVKEDGTYFERTVDNKQYPGQVYATYSVFFKKTGTGSTTVEFGLEANENFAAAGANGFGFGCNKVYYLGSEEQYLTDTKAELQAKVAEAKTLAANSTANYWTAKLNRYIANAEAATTAKEMQNALHGLKEVSARINGLTMGIEAVSADRQGTDNMNRKGIYTMTGIKVDGDIRSLKPGLYIVNGKKCFIK